MNPVTWSPEKNKKMLWRVNGLASRPPQMQTVELGEMLFKIFSRVSPPPRASKKQSQPFFVAISLSWTSQSPVVTTVSLIPYLSKTSADSCRLTKPRRGMPSVLHSLVSICPKLEAAAEWMIPPLCLALKVSTNPIAVRGFTSPEAADWMSTSSEISKVVAGWLVLYSHQVPQLEKKLTLLPTQLWTSSPLALTTYPVPSSPATAGSSLLKYPPERKMTSEGLMVEASTLMRSSPASGLGLGTVLSFRSLPYSSMMRA